MHGYGEMIYKDGSVYQGTWKDNKRDGQGTYKDGPLGYQYYGSWKEDQKHGHGVITYSNGEVLQGDWVNDKKNGKYIKYWLDQKE